MRSTKKLFYILGLLLVMLPFQNCGIRPQNLSLSSTEKTTESGNGGGYEGKPDGTYYHYIPSYTCEGKPSAEQITEIKNGQAFLYANKDNQCANQSTPIPVDDINFSPFQNEFISVKDSLFKRYDEKPVGIPNNLAEVLCRDNFENPTFEIVSHYDREKNEALTRVYLPDRQISDFSVSRILSSNEVRYVAENISFIVDLSKPAFAERKFTGQIEKTTIAGLPVQSLVCVVGGSIDTSKWALTALTNVNVGSFQLMKNNEILFFSEVSRHYFSSTLYSYVKHLFNIGADGVVSDFSKMVFGEQYDVIHQNGKVDDVLNLFTAKLTSEGWTSLFVYDSRTGRAKRLTNLKAGVEPEIHGLNRPVLTSDQHLIYDTQILQASLSTTLVVRAYNFNDDSIEDVATLGADNEKGYSVLPKANKLLIYWRIKNSIKNVIEVYDTKSKTSTDVTLQMPGNCRVIGFDAKNVSDESGVLTTQICDESNRSLVQITLADGGVKVLGVESSISWVSDDGNTLVLTNASKANVAYDVRTGKTTSLPIDPRFGYDGSTSGLTDFSQSQFSSKMALASDRYLYGFGGNTGAPVMYQVDLVSGVSTPVCDAAAGKKLFLGILPNQKVFVFTYDAALKVYRFYQAKSPTDCARINEFPSEYPNVPKIIPTNIGFGLLLGSPITIYSTNPSPEAVFVPIDGRPPLKFNPNSKGNWQMEVSADKNRIVLRGPDADDVIRIFSFDL